ncbi:HalOD1 output domain-containing protein [Halalkalicoccus salilacus]|uniref:HalOD1 output domain-containing protein n=2 Tax=Halalkalicoccus TaxID=332246 RepID=UPI002F964DBC
MQNSMTASLASAELESLEYHRDSATYRAEYDPNSTSTSMAVVASLSEVTGIDPIELDPLGASVDTDALDEIVQVRGRTNGDRSVAFTVEGYEITVYSYGLVTIASAEHGRNEGVPLR